MNCSAENSLITALVYDDPTFGTGVDEAAGLLTLDDFANEGCRLSFAALLKLRQEGLPIDSCHAVDAMIENGVPSSRAVPLWTDATDGSPLPGSIAAYAKKIKAQGRERKLAKSIGLAGERLQSGVSAPDVKEELFSEIEQIEADLGREEIKTLEQIAMPTLNAIADMMSGDDSRRGLRSGLPELDSATKGFKPGELWICGGMPGRGKTSFALQAAMNLIGAGFPVLFISLEMSASELYRRLMKMRFGAKVVSAPSDEEMSAMIEYSADIQSLPIYIYDGSAMETDELAAMARLKVARSGIRLVIVDHLQLIRGSGRDRREKINDAVEMLRRLAKDTQVPVLALSQLRRPDNLNDRPSMIELKESGDIEAAAHVVLLTYMPILEDGSFAGEEEIIIGKQREGPTGSIPVYFDRSKVLFRERIRT